MKRNVIEWIKVFRNATDPWAFLKCGENPTISSLHQNKWQLYEIQQSEEKSVARHAHTIELRTIFTLIESIRSISNSIVSSLCFIFPCHSARTMHHHMHNHNHNCRRYLCTHDSISGCRLRIQTTRRSKRALPYVAMGVHKKRNDVTIVELCCLCVLCLSWAQSLSV